MLRAPRSFVVAALIAGVALATASVRADPGDPTEVEAQRLTHILVYVGTDYRVAVEGGAIKSQIEYDEQLSLLGDAARIASRIEDLARARAGEAEDLAGGVAALRALVEARADAADVAAAAAALRRRVEAAFHLADAPLAPPDPVNAEALFAQSCAPCHGATGRADTARAAELSPRPVSFQDAEVADHLSPTRIASAVRFGVAGTAMAAFNVLSEEDRWAIAFHVAGLRHAEASGARENAAPARSQGEGEGEGEGEGQGEGEEYSLVELALRTDADLRAELGARGVPEGQREARVARLRLEAPYEGARSQGPLARARAALHESRAALRAGDPGRARAEVAAAHAGGLAEAGPWVRALDGELADGLEERALAARAALEGEAPPESPEATDAAVNALLGEATYAEVRLATPGSAPGFGGVARAALGGVVAGGGAAAVAAAALLGRAAARAGGLRAVRAALGAAFVLGAGSAIALGQPSATGFLLAGASGVLGALAVGVAGAAGAPPGERAGGAAPGFLSLVTAAALLAGHAAVLEGFWSGLLPFLRAPSAGGAAAFGAIAGAALLIGITAALGRAARAARAARVAGAQRGRLHAALALVAAVMLAGRGVAALERAGLLPVRLLPLPHLPPLGLHPTLSACAAQATIAAIWGALFFRSRRLSRLGRRRPSPPA